MTALNDLNGYLDDEAYTIRVGELRALLSASIADTADNAQCDTGKCGIGGYCKECPSIADTAKPVIDKSMVKRLMVQHGLDKSHESIADTAGARPDPKARMEYAEGILRATPKLLPTFAIEDLLKRCEDSDDREDVWEAIQAQADIRAREAIFAQLERGRVAAPPAPSVADAAVIDYGAFYAQDMDRRLAKLDVGPQIADAAGASEGQEPVAWAAVHFGGKRNGEIYSTSATKEQIDAYIDQVHQSSDSLTLSARPIAFADAAPPAPSVADAKCMCSGLGPCEKLSNCRKAPSVADAAGASETITLDMVRDAAFGAGLTLFQWDRLKFELKDAIAKESGND